MYRTGDACLPVGGLFFLLKIKLANSAKDARGIARLAYGNPRK